MPEKKQRAQPPKFSFPKASAPQDSKMGVPGPGNYELIDENKRSNRVQAPSASMKRRYKDTSETFTPGPIYNPNFDLPKKAAPKFTMRPKTAIKDKEDTPAPTHYNPTYDSAKKVIISNVRFGKDKRKDLSSTNAVPGPGRYEINYKDTSGPKYHMGLKTEIPAGTMKNPGPGHYDNKTLFEFNIEKNKGTSLVPRRPESASLMANPGPGTYEQTVQPGKRSAPKISIGKQGRNNMTKEQLMKPGPGAYEFNPKLKGTNEPKYGFGTSQRGTAKSTVDTPGPGFYQYQEPPGKNAPKYLMGLKTKVILGNENVPGPGSYDPSIEKYSRKRAAPKIGMGTSMREGFYQSSDTPGPGVYYRRPESGREAPKMVFGTQSRMKDERMSAGPTPTTYEIKSIFESGLEKKKGMSMTQRRPMSASVMNNPGPGTYSQDVQPIKYRHPKPK